MLLINKVSAMMKSLSLVGGNETNPLRETEKDKILLTYTVVSKNNMLNIHICLNVNSKYDFEWLKLLEKHNN